MILDYDPPLYRPPSEGSHLIIQATLGCSFNLCSFCSMYKSKTYRARSLAEVQHDINRAAEAHPAAHRVFLADGDALSLPTAHLVQLLDHLTQRLPRLARVACYATPINLLRKSASELALLRERKLSLLYLGIESGANRILKRIAKGASQRSLHEAMCKAAAAGMKVSGTVILGLGGQRYWQEHIDGSADLLSRAPLNYLSTLQLMLDPTVEAPFMDRFGGHFEWQSDHAILLEQQRLIREVTPPSALIFRSNHASNALALSGNLPKDRKRLLEQIQQALDGNQALRPDFLRGI